MLSEYLDVAVGHPPKLKDIDQTDKKTDQIAFPDDTDPGSRTMRTHDGWNQGYNDYAMVDTDSQVIVAQAVTDESNDKQQLKPMLENCEETNGDRPDQLLADAGYWSEANADLAAGDMELFVTTKRTGSEARSSESKDRLAVGIRLPTARGTDWNASSDQFGRAICKKRGLSVQPVFGQIVLSGLDRFPPSWTDRAADEWSLSSATHNLLKLFRSVWTPDRVGATATNG